MDRVGINGEEYTCAGFYGQFSKLCLTFEIRPVSADISVVFGMMNVKYDKGG